jgi:hypothetical protein
MHRAHAREVAHDAPVAHGRAGDVVPAAAHGQHEALVAREADRRDDVEDVRASRHERGPAIDHPVPHPPGSLVIGIPGADELAAKLAGEASDGGVGRAGARGGRWHAASLVSGEVPSIDGRREPCVRAA